MNSKTINYGIITHYDVHNHGALLQLNALIEVLKSFGIKSKALQFEKNYDFFDRSQRAKYNLSIKSISIYIKYLINRGIGCTLYNFKKSRVLNGYKKEKGLIGPYYADIKELAGIVIGSDEVFALHTGPTPVFWGYALPSKKVFSYAGCFGPTTLEEIENRYCKNFVSSGLNSMVGLGMRDQNSMHIARTLAQKEPVLVCDPVILYGYESEISNLKRRIDKPYLVVYSYDGKFEESSEAIREYAKKKNLLIVSPGFYQKWADININATPDEILGYFKYAEIVITNTFHGCVMSLITNRNIAVKLRGNANKLQNLLDEFSLTDRIFTDLSSLESVLSSPVDWVRVNLELEHRRKASLAYLKEMINL